MVKKYEAIPFSYTSYFILLLFFFHFLSSKYNVNAGLSFLFFSHNFYNHSFGKLKKKIVDVPSTHVYYIYTISIYIYVYVLICSPTTVLTCNKLMSKFKIVYVSRRNHKLNADLVWYFQCSIQDKKI